MLRTNSSSGPTLFPQLSQLTVKAAVFTGHFDEKYFSDVGAGSAGEVVDCLRQQKVTFNFANKQELAELMRLNTTDQLVFKNSTKLGSHIKAAVSAGVEDFYVDSVEELAKIKRYHGSARYGGEETPSGLVPNINLDVQNPH